MCVDVGGVGMCVRCCCSLRIFSSSCFLFASAAWISAIRFIRSSSCLRFISSICRCRASSSCLRCSDTILSRSACCSRRRISTRSRSSLSLCSRSSRCLLSASLIMASCCLLWRSESAPSAGSGVAGTDPLTIAAIFSKSFLSIPLVS